MGHSQPFVTQTTRGGPPLRNGFSGPQASHGGNLGGSTEGQQVSEDEGRLVATAVMTTPGRPSDSHNDRSKTGGNTPSLP